MFGRRKRDGKPEGAPDERNTDAEDSAEGTPADEGAGGAARVKLPPAPRPDGPWDLSEVSEPDKGRVDLGGVFVPGVEGMELRVEVAGDAIVAATVVLRDSAIQLQAFAAPRREGLWDEVRE